MWEELEMGLQRKTGTGFKPRSGSHARREHVALVEKGERTTRLWQHGDPVVVTQLMVPGA